MRRLAFVAALILTFGLASTASAASIVLNGSFETGDFTSWTQSGNTGFTGIQGGGVDGVFEAFFGPVSSEGFITQNLTTVAGQTYTLSYYLSHDGGTINSFRVLIDGVTLGAAGVNLGAFGYTAFTTQFVAAGPVTALGFGFRQDPAYFRLDNVAVEAAVPEPSTWLLLGTGLAAFAARRRFARK